MDDTAAGTTGAEHHEVPTRRRRLMGVGIALALVAGPVAGFEVGQRLGDRDRVAVASEGDDEPDQQPDVPDVGVELPAPSGDDARASGGLEADRGYGFGHPLGHDLQRAGVVDLGAVTVRLLRSDFGPPDTGNPTWEPPVGCYPDGTVIAQASTPHMVAIVSGETFGLRSTEGVVQLAGVAEGDPYWIVAGATDTSSATVRFPDGQVVEAAIVDGVFTAVAPAGDADHRTEPTATVVADGNEFPIRTWEGPIDEDFHRQCEPPPPALPPAGEQPADPDDARAQIAEAFRLGYGGGDGQLDAFADPGPLAAVFEALDASESFDSYRGKITATVGEIVFDSPTHAWLFYDLDPVLSQRIGEAVLTDRGWTVANETICADVQLAGVQC